ncbi:hypothetical protein DMENIID0001_143570 [Sergentomyia squamirostris]
MDDGEKFDIYGDLNDFDESVKLKDVTVELEELRKKHEKIEKDLKTTEAVNKHQKAINTILKKNFSSLLLTSRAELKRKDGSIGELRKDLEDLTFRRKKGRFGKVDKETQTEAPTREKSPRRENGFREDRHRRDRYDRFKDSFTKERSLKRKQEDDRKSAKRRKSQPRSSSRDRVYSHRREDNRRHIREYSRERESRKQTRETRESNRNRSREKPKKEIERKKETSKTPVVSLVQENPPVASIEATVTISPTKMEKLHQETQDAVENLLISQQERIEKEEQLNSAPLVENNQELSEPPPEMPHKVPDEPEQKRQQEILPETICPEEVQSIETNEVSPSKTISLGNTDYTFMPAEQGVAVLYIKRKKRKSGKMGKTK